MPSNATPPIPGLGLSEALSSARWKVREALIFDLWRALQGKFGNCSLDQFKRAVQDAILHGFVEQCQLRPPAGQEQTQRWAASSMGVSQGAATTFNALRIPPGLKEVAAMRAARLSGAQATEGTPPAIHLSADAEVDTVSSRDPPATKAQTFAALLNGIVARGEEVPQRMLELVEGDLRGSGWFLDKGQGGRWQALREGSEQDAAVEMGTWEPFTGSAGSRKGRKGWRKGGLVSFGDLHPSDRQGPRAANSSTLRVSIDSPR
jgi:hypothetical protein